jgi:mercuric ion transport protein
LQAEYKKKSLNGYLLLISGFIVCPCHIPILLAIAGGTALGVFISKNLTLILGLSTVYFILALIIGFRMIRRKAEAVSHNKATVKLKRFK